MKNIIIIFLVSLLLQACFQDKSKLLVGKWKKSFNIEAEMQKMSKAEREAYEKIDEEEAKARIEDLKEAWQSHQYVFRENNKYQLLVEGEIEQEGIWQLSVRQDTLYIIDSTRTKDVLFIKEMTKEEMSLVPVIGGVLEEEELFFVPIKKNTP